MVGLTISRLSFKPLIEVNMLNPFIIIGIMAVIATISSLHIIAKAPKYEPTNRLPTSPLKTFAGYLLYLKYPNSVANIIAEAYIANKSNSFLIDLIIEDTSNAVKLKIIEDDITPLKTSIMFTAFEVTAIANGIIAK